MATFLETISYGTSGVKARTVGFQPLKAHFRVGKKTGGTINYLQQSDGITDGSLQYCDSLYWDGTGETKRSSTKVISQWEKLGGVWTEVFAASLDSFTATQVKFNITTPNPDYQIQLEVDG